MTSKLPSILSRYKICIICEGYEEYEYLQCLKKLEVWHKQYQIDLDNAKGNGNIPARYQDRYQNDAYDLVLIFCDTEGTPYEQYEDIKNKIDRFHGVGGVASEVILFGNPCTMQIILKHWTDENLTSPGKKKNAPLIFQCTGVENYKGKQRQIVEMMKQISRESYCNMKNRVKSMNPEDTVLGSSNFGRFLDWFEGEGIDWIKDINEKLES